MRRGDARVGEEGEPGQRLRLPGCGKSQPARGLHALSFIEQGCWTKQRTRRPPARSPGAQYPPAACRRGAAAAEQQLRCRCRGLLPPHRAAKSIKGCLHCRACTIMLASLIAHWHAAGAWHRHALAVAALPRMCQATNSGYSLCRSRCLHGCSCRCQCMKIEGKFVFLGTLVVGAREPQPNLPQCHARTGTP